jgi:hypothetical protein
MEKADFYPRDKVPVKAVKENDTEDNNDPTEMLISLFAAIISLCATIYWMTSSRNPYYTEEASHLTSIIPLLMIVGPQLVGKALAITIASPRNDFACFGFGLLGYAFNLLISAFTGFADVLPKPEILSKVLNLKSGQGRQNGSFVLSRVLRDLESRYETKKGGLVIEVLNAVAPAAPLSGRRLLQANNHMVIVLVAQFCAALGYAFLYSGDISVFLILLTSLCALQTVNFLPAWGVQKFSARKDGSKNAVYALLRGNGHRHVFIINNVHPEAWNLEDLAFSGLSTYDGGHYELAVTCALFIIFLLLTMLATQLSYFGTIIFICMMFYGSLGNLLIAALPRAPWAHGVALESVETIQDDRKVMTALQELENKHPGHGLPLVKEFFPGGLRENDQTWWDEAREFAEKESDFWNAGSWPVEC